VGLHHPFVSSVHTPFVPSEVESRHVVPGYRFLDFARNERVKEIIPL
jgi:hypothetical protein